METNVIEDMRIVDVDIVMLTLFVRNILVLYGKFATCQQHLLMTYSRGVFILTKENIEYEDQTVSMTILWRQKLHVLLEK